MFHTGIIAQTAQLGAVHLTFKNTNSLRGPTPCSGENGDKWQCFGCVLTPAWLRPFPWEIFTGVAQGRGDGNSSATTPCLCLHLLPSLGLERRFDPAQFGDGWQWGELRVLSSLSGSLSKVSESL